MHKGRQACCPTAHPQRPLIPSTSPRTLRSHTPQVNNYANEGGINGPVVGTSEVNGGPRTTATIPNKRRPSKLRVGITLGGGESFPGIRLGRGGDYWVVAAGQSEDPANRSGNLYGQWLLGAGIRAHGDECCVQCACTVMRARACAARLLHSRCAAHLPAHPPTDAPSSQPPFPPPDWAIVTGGRPSRRSNGACATGSPFGLVRRFQTNNVGLWLFTRKPIDPANTQVGGREVWRCAAGSGGWWASTACPSRHEAVRLVVVPAPWPPNAIFRQSQFRASNLRCALPTAQLRS